MADDTARAVGAGDGEVTVAGKVCHIRPLRVRELAELERDCLRRYKLEVLESYSDSVRLLDNGDAVDLMRRKRDEVSAWDVGDLPHKYAHDSRRVVLTDALRGWLQQRYELGDGAGDNEDENRTADNALKRLTAAALDSGSLSESQYKKLTDTDPCKVPVGYADWWVTGCYDGMASMLWLTFRPDGVTRDDILDYCSFAEMAQLTRRIELLTVPKLGNG